MGRRYVFEDPAEGEQDGDGTINDSDRGQRRGDTLVDGGIPSQHRHHGERKSPQDEDGGEGEKPGDRLQVAVQKTAGKLEDGGEEEQLAKCGNHPKTREESIGGEDDGHAAAQGEPWAVADMQAQPKEQQGDERGGVAGENQVTMFPGQDLFLPALPPMAQGEGEDDEERGVPPWQQQSVLEQEETAVELGENCEELTKRRQRAKAQPMPACSEGNGLGSQSDGAPIGGGVLPGDDEPGQEAQGTEEKALGHPAVFL